MAGIDSHHGSSSLFPDTASKPSWFGTAAPAFAFAGVQASWAVQIGHGSAQLSKLGLREDLVGLAWLAGPITGAIVQPLVGVWSDRSTSRFGKRRPFMLLGAIGLLIGLVVFSQAGNIARALGDPIKSAGGGSKTGLGIAILSFWVIDVFTNTLQGPARALLADVAPAARQLDGSAAFGVANGAGKIIGYAAGSSHLGIEFVYGMTGGIVFLLTLLTVFATHEPPCEEDPEKQGGQEHHSSGDGNISVITRLLTMQPMMAKAFLVQSLTYFSMMIFFVWGGVWVGKDVFGGDASAATKSDAHLAFVHGVRVANQGLLIMSILSIFIALLIPPLIRHAVGVRVLWASSLFVFGAGFLMAKFIRTREAVFALYGCLSFPLAVSFTIPWFIAEFASRDAAGQRGRELANFNLSQSLPGVAAALIGGTVVRISGGDLDNVIMLGGGVALLASFAVSQVDVPPEVAG